MAAIKRDPKQQALQECGTLHTRPADVTDELFLKDDFFDRRDLVQIKYEMLRRVRVDGQPIRQVARAFGFSRPSFYAAQAAFARAGLSGLLPDKRGPRRAHKLSVTVMEFVSQELKTDPAKNAPTLAQAIDKKFGLSVHPRSVERALQRNLKKTP